MVLIVNVQNIDNDLLILEDTNNSIIYKYKILEVKECVKEHNISRYHKIITDRMIILNGDLEDTYDEKTNTFIGNFTYYGDVIELEEEEIN